MKNHIKPVVALYSLKTIKAVLMFVFVFIAAYGESINADVKNNTARVSDSSAPNLTIDSARWNPNNKQLQVSGSAPPGVKVVVKNAATDEPLGSTRTTGENNRDGGKAAWSLTIDNPAPVPCRIRAEASQFSAEKDVANAPEDCDKSAPPPTSHAGRFTTYEGSKTCMGCHDTEIQEVHASVHYQWQGPTPYVVNMTSGGKLHGINDFCGYPDINFIGQLTNLDGAVVDGGCATCHTGMGAKPDPVATQAQLENIDCLSCHSDSYRRKVVKLSDGSFHFEVAPEKMTVPVIQAITDIQRTPTRGACVNCHSYAGGGCNNKRGDMEEEHRNPGSASFDVHMASTAVGGAGLTCVDCHVTQNHRIAGRGADLRPTDLDVPVRCTNCHAERPHNNRNIDKHTARVDCTVCHIPEFAKVTSTDMIRDYSKPPVLDTAKQLYDPNMERAAQVKPEIAFWNGNSVFYQFGTPAALDPAGRVLMAGPLGDINDSSAKLYAFKHHLAVLPHDPVSGRILPMKMGILFQSGNVDRAIIVGASEVGWSLPKGYDFIAAERYMGIFHEVSPASDALACNDCHNGGNRVDFTDLGYRPRPDRDPAIATNCASGCHENESDEWSASAFFIQVHARHVDRQGLACSRCHGF